MNRLAVEFRAALDGNRLAGHAAVFGVFADLPGHYEALARTAFDETLAAGTDVKALVNHNPSLVLGSTKGKTLRLEVDDTGLAFEVDLPNTTYANDLRELVSRNDVTAMSFGFLPGLDEWGRAPDGKQVRTHTSVRQLLDVSPVAFPAYEGTDVSLRSRTFPAITARAQLIRLRAARLVKEGN